MKWYCIKLGKSLTSYLTFTMFPISKCVVGNTGHNTSRKRAKQLLYSFSSLKRLLRQLGSSFYPNQFVFWCSPKALRKVIFSEINAWKSLVWLFSMGLLFILDFILMGGDKCKNCEKVRAICPLEFFFHNFKGSMSIIKDFFLKVALVQEYEF